MPSTQSFLLIRRPAKPHSKMQLLNTNINSAGFSRVLLWANTFLQCPLSPSNNCATTTCPTWGFVLTLLLERKRRWWRYQSSSSFSSGLLRWERISERPIRRLCMTRTLAAYIWPAKFSASSLTNLAGLEVKGSIIHPLRFTVPSDEVSGCSPCRFLVRESGESSFCCLDRLCLFI